MGLASGGPRGKAIGLNAHCPRGEPIQEWSGGIDVFRVASGRDGLTTALAAVGVDKADPDRSDQRLGNGQAGALQVLIKSRPQLIV